MNHVAYSNSRRQRLSARTCGPQSLSFFFFFCSVYPAAACPYALNDKWLQEIQCGASFCPDVAVESLSLSPSVYYRRLTWVIAEMEEHLGQQQGFSGGERLKGYLREDAGTQRDSWFMEQAERYKQQMSFAKSLCDFSLLFIYSQQH